MTVNGCPCGVLQVHAEENFEKRKDKLADHQARMDEEIRAREEAAQKVEQEAQKKMKEAQEAVDQAQQMGQQVNSNCSLSAPNEQQRLSCI